MAQRIDMKGDWDRRAQERPEKYIAGFHDATPEEFRESGKRDARAMFHGLENLLDPERDAIDIGCGIGRMDEFLAPLLRSLCGIDVSGEMVRRARERLRHLENARFVEGDGLSLPLPDACAELVFSYIVFQHMPRSLVPRYFAEAHRVLRPGGHFVFQIPERNERVRTEPPDEDSYAMRFWSAVEVECALASASLAIERFDRLEIGEPHERFVSMRFCARKASRS